MANQSGASTKGLAYAAFGIVDSDGKLVTGTTSGANFALPDPGVVLVDGAGQGAVTANVTGLSGTPTRQYANNTVKRVTYGNAQPQVALTMLDMPNNVLQPMLGNKSNGKGGYLPTGQHPHVALLLAYRDYSDNLAWIGFANGTLSRAAMNHATDNQNETDANATLTYTALDPIIKSTFANPLPGGPQANYALYDSTDSGFDFNAMLKEVFGGYDDSTTHQFAGYGATVSK